MIAKLIVHAPTRERGDRPDDRGAQRVRHPRHRVEHRLPVRARAASAFRARDASPPRSSRRSIPNGFRARTSRPRIPRCSPRWPPPCIAPIATAPRASTARCRATSSTVGEDYVVHGGGAEYAAHARPGRTAAATCVIDDETLRHSPRVAFRRHPDARNVQRRALRRAGRAAADCNYRLHASAGRSSTCTVLPRRAAELLKLMPHKAAAGHARASCSRRCRVCSPRSRSRPGRRSRPASGWSSSRR